MLFLAGGIGALSLIPAAPALAQTHHGRHHVHHAHLRHGHGVRPQVGRASYFSPREAGRTTASGKPARPHMLTAASPTLPLGTKARVVDEKTGKSVKVTVTDRGPYARNRILDVSPAAAEKLGMKDKGVAVVKVEPLHVPRPEH